MKKYKNISHQRLSIDCISHTMYLEAGVIVFLPVSRDVRHNLKLGKLVVIREPKKEIVELPKKELPKFKVKRDWKQNKEEKPDSNSEKMETE